jgi:hypothetical protein
MRSSLAYCYGGNKFRAVEAEIFHCVGWRADASSIAVLP